MAEEKNKSDGNGIFLPYDQFGRLCYALAHAKTTMYDNEHTIYDIIRILVAGGDIGSTPVLSVNGQTGDVEITSPINKVNGEKGKTVNIYAPTTIPENSDEDYFLSLNGGGSGEMENFAVGAGGSFPKTENNTGGGLAHNDMPPYFPLNFIIKYM